MENVVLPERDRRDDEADDDLVDKAQCVEARRGHATAVGHPPETGGSRNGHDIDDLKRPCAKKTPRRRVANEDRQPVSGIDDKVECEREQEEPRQEPDAPPDLLENLGRER